MSQSDDVPFAFVLERGGSLTLDEIHRRHGPWLIAFLRRRFAPQDAEDLAQEAYLRAAGAKSAIRNPRAFLAHVAINAARDLARRAAARPTYAPEADHPTPASPAEQAEALLLKQIILGLPPRLREVFLLSRFGGLTQPEIARRLGISLKTVEGRMTQALALCNARLRD